MGQRDYFFERLKSELGPALRHNGFRGSRPTFRRTRGDFIHVLTVQRSDTGLRCYVNLGVHLTFLPDGRGITPDPRGMAEPDCEFRTRLEPGDGTGCWLYGTTHGEADASVRSLVSSVLTNALTHFDKYQKPEQLLAAVEPIELEAHDLKQLPGHLTLIRGMLALARIAKHLGDPDRAKQYARIGLAEAETRGLPFKGKFREFLDSE